MWEEETTWDEEDTTWRRKKDSNSWDKKRLLIESVVAIAIAVFSLWGGVKYGQSHNTYFYNGKEVSETELNEIMAENAEFKASNDYLKTENTTLSSKIDELISENLKYEEENKKLISENTSMESSISDFPTLEFQDCGLSINGDEIPINKDRSYAEINGRQYFSRDFIDCLLPNTTTNTMKDGMLYIGKIIKEKTSLFDLVQVKASGYQKWDNIVDTYGNSYSNVLFLESSGNEVTYSAERSYSSFKCVAAMKSGGTSSGYIQIETDDPEYTYISPKINNLTEPFEIDIPINNTSTITIKCVNGSYNSFIFISNPTLYNQE